MTDAELRIKSIQYRIRLLQHIKRAKAGHTGGSLSCVDILNVLYNQILNVSPGNCTDPARDRYVQSKGHSVEALYVVLADRGFFPESDLETLCRFGSPYVGHPTRKIPGIEQNTGALGHGLAFSVGVALAGKKDNAAYRVFTLLGDGELAEGSNWESMLTAAHYRLDNLTAIVDRNQLQITGRTEDVCGLECLAAKFQAFGWAVQTVDGHDVTALTKVLSGVPFESGKPSVVIARTVKGKGVSFMENQARWHHGVPSDAQYEQALRELEALRAELLVDGSSFLVVGSGQPPAISNQQPTTNIVPGSSSLVDGSSLLVVGSGQQPPTNNQQPRPSTNQPPTTNQQPTTQGKANLDVFAEALLALARDNRHVLAVTSDSRGSGKLTAFAAALPDQIVEVGIAEQNLVGIAAGLASAGKIVYAVSPASFLTARALEQIKNDICYSDQPVKLVGISAGVSYGALGSTHHALHDLAALRAIPNCTIIVPADNLETVGAIQASARMSHPVYLRFGKRPLPAVHRPGTIFEVGKALLVRPGVDVAFIATGETVIHTLQAAGNLEKEGVSARVISMHTVKPLDVPAVLRAAQECRAIVTVEEHSCAGGLGEACAAVLMQAGLHVPFRIVGFPDEDTVTGSQLEIFAHYGISARGLADTAKRLLEAPKR